METIITFFKDLWDPLSIPSGAVLGLLIAKLWSKYRGRVIPIRFESHVQSLAISSNDSFYGNVEVMYNGRQASNLYMANVEISNESHKDLVDVEVQIGFRDGTTFLSGGGIISGSLSNLSFAPGFQRELQKYLDLPENEKTPEMIEPLIKNRFFNIPVLNRGATASFTFLVEEIEGIFPQPVVSIQHEGVKLSERPALPLTFGVRNDVAALVGLIASLLLFWGLAGYFDQKVWLILSGVFLGGVAAHFGAFLVRLFKAVVTILT
mgnify:CR=1 FL=1|tara:strand:+ start:1140 stop:1931 length:792 start_codon:yes stop_codon:yes gene_type:complete